MATRTAVTHRDGPYRRGVLDSQPISAPAFKSQNRALLKKESRFYVDLDGNDLMNWLNAAAGTESIDRVKAIISEVRDLGAAFRLNAVRLFTPGPRRPATPQQRNLQRGNAKIYKALVARHTALENALSKYTFRPKATWLVPDSDWLLKLYADDVKNEFFVELGQRHYGEADAVMSILRLTEKGYLDKIHLCPNCERRWRYAAKSHYKFCSEECREQFYKSSPNYSARKAENQRRYRANRKRYLASKKRRRLRQ